MSAPKIDPLALPSAPKHHAPRRTRKQAAPLRGPSRTVRPRRQNARKRHVLRPHPRPHPRCTHSRQAPRTKQTRKRRAHRRSRTRRPPRVGEPAQERRPHMHIRRRTGATHTPPRTTPLRRRTLPRRPRPRAPATIHRRRVATPNAPPTLARPPAPTAAPSPPPCPPATIPPCDPTPIPGPPPRTFLTLPSPPTHRPCALAPRCGTATTTLAIPPGCAPAQLARYTHGRDLRILDTEDSCICQR